ncbi:hypothetical protein EYF80_062834 [Liparis tanakae]|uniref:Uncharacterized protein n=1 Tax=Liparis tanakae TaxID=230148 RepID=A0A4Z2EFC6_9TELE|nr:hypothetical protein EYF80_062834 [Liparis tanakae]
MLHAHEDDVDDQADDDPEVKEGARDEAVEALLEPPPAATAAPLQEDGPAPRTQRLSLQP